MIAVKLNRADFEYDIYSLVKAFFPAEEVTVSVGEKADKEAISFRIVTNYLQDRFEVWLKEPQEDTPKHKLSVETDFSDRKETKNRLKRAYYEILSNYSKKTLPWGTLTGIRPVKIPMGFLEEGKDEAQIWRYMKETHFVSDEKIKLSIDVAKREFSLLSKLDYETGYSLYIGIPFCPSACLYCSFTSYPLSAWESRIDEYLDALSREILFAAGYFKGKHLNAVYIGGGTPTSLGAAQLKRLVSRVFEHFDMSHCLEFTVEAGRPDSITREKLLALKEEGVTRISINPQTMKEDTLKIIGRHHTAKQTEEQFYLARSLGFDNINMDLIAGLPNETLFDVTHTMQKIAALHPDNLTVHSLALKRAAKLSMFREEYQDLTFENTQETIAVTADYAKQMGMEPYYLYRQKNMAGNFENVGYATEGKEGIYNVLAMEEKQTVIACGAGSISKRVYPDGSVKRCENVKDVTQYIGRIDEMIERKRQLFGG